jgi:flagellar motor switch/type III secretory pathway protein FliN
VGAVVADEKESMSLRTYKLVNRSEQAALLARIEQGVQRWIDLYAADDERAQCAYLPPDDEAAQDMRVPEWLVATRAADGRGGPGLSEPLFAIGLAPGWPSAFTGLTVSEDQAASLDAAGLELMREVGVGLLEQLGQSVLEAMLAARALTWNRSRTALIGSMAGADGHVICSCRVGPHLTVMFALWPATVTECLAREAPKFAAGSSLNPLSKALHAEAVELDAIAGEVELTIEELRSLAVGDVVKLNRKISQPLQVCVRDGGVVCAARLGAVSGHTALQLTAGTA